MEDHWCKKGVHNLFDRQTLSPIACAQAASGHADVKDRAECVLALELELELVKGAVSASPSVALISRI